MGDQAGLREHGTHMAIACNHLKVSCALASLCVLGSADTTISLCHAHLMQVHVQTTGLRVLHTCPPAGSCLVSVTIQESHPDTHSRIGSPTQGDAHGLPGLSVTTTVITGIIEPALNEGFASSVYDSSCQWHIHRHYMHGPSACTGSRLAFVTPYVALQGLRKVNSPVLLAAAVPWRAEPEGEADHTAVWAGPYCY